MKTKQPSFFDVVLPRVAHIQTALPSKDCPKCKRRMYLARHFSEWTCEKCDLGIPFTEEEIKLVNKYEKAHHLHKTGRKK